LDSPFGGAQRAFSMQALFIFLAFLIALPASAADVLRFESAERGFAVNSWLVPTDTGLIAVDTQFTTGEARKLVQAIKETGLPLKAIIITHPHPDHYNGTCQLLEFAQVPVYATQATIEGILATAEAKREQWKPVYRDGYPDSTCVPDHPVPDGGRLTLDGLDLEILDYGAGEAGGESIVLAPSLRAVFVGDLIYNKTHPWLAEGRTELWLAQLERLSEEFPYGWTLYPGHGPAEGAAAIMGQYNYILEFRDAVEAKLPAGLDSKATKDLSDEIEARYPGWPLAASISMNAAAVAEELRAQNSQSTH
jgi:glyoxylase-like metal-dependent hydrolase (beta-lactamase superfamily II)